MVRVHQVPSEDGHAAQRLVESGAPPVDEVSPCERQARAQFLARMSHELSGITLFVCDDGCGMSAEQLEHLFEPFNRLGKERSGIEGTGIGLALSKALVEHMGGRITVTSCPDKGSKFALWLPIAEQARANCLCSGHSQATRCPAMNGDGT